MGARYAASLVATLLTGVSVAGSLTAQTSESTTNSSSSPVAYVYVSRPTHLDGFAASSSGKLTPVPGSPFANIDVSHLSVTKKFLFGAGDDNQTIYTYSIASNGSVKKIAEINTHLYTAPPNDDECYNVGPTQIDYTGTILYNDQWNCDEDSQYIQSYKIESNGELKFLADSGGESEDYEMSPPVVLGTNKYLYVAGNYDSSETGGFLQSYKRQSNGSMKLFNSYIALPSPENSADTYSPIPELAVDPTDHLVLAMQPDNTISGNGDGPTVLASFTAQPNGNVTTTNTLSNMAVSSEIPLPYNMSISPTGKLLAISGGGQGHTSGYNGFQLFHFNGANPITPYTGVLQNRLLISQFAWDKSNHLYVLGGGYLFVYTVTPTSVVEAPGSPYSIPESSSVIVLSL